MPIRSSDAQNLHPGLTFRIQTPVGWQEMVVPVAFEGHHVHWVFRPRFAASDARSRGGPDGLPGKYRVVLTLAKPGYPQNLPGTHASESELEGDSNLYVGKEFGDRNVFFLGTEHQRYKVSLSANAKGRLGKLILDDLDANSLIHARSLAWCHITPLLSFLSARLDIPIKVNQIDVVEIRTGAISGETFIDYPDVGLHVAGLTGMSEDLRHYVSMYREALNSSSPLYEFLCLFKVIESVMSRRKRKAVEANGRGEAVARPHERFPERDELPAWLDSLLPPTTRKEWEKVKADQAFPPEVFGRRLGSIIESYLRPLRNRVAHLLLDTGELGYSPDEYDHFHAVEHWLPTTKFLVRKLLKDEFPSEFLAAVATNADPPRD